MFFLEKWPRSLVFPSGVAGVLQLARVLQLQMILRRVLHFGTPVSTGSRVAHNRQ